MEGSHSVSSGLAHQDDSWTCQRCGWVYPNAHPSAKHRRNHKKQCGKIKGFELRSELHKGGSSDEASSGDDSHTKKDNLPPQSATIGSAVPAVEHPNAPPSRDLLVTEVNVSGKVKSDAPILQGISASLDAKPEVTDHECTRDIINLDAVKAESPAPEPEPNIVSLDKTSKTFEEGMVPAHILPGLYTDEAKEFVKDIKCEDPPTVEEHSDSHTLQADSVEAVVRDLPGLDSDQANSAENKDANSEDFSPKHTENIASLEEPSKTPQDESKVTLTPCVNEVEKAAHESHGLESDHATAKESLLISKEQGLNREGSSQVDDSWTCHHCGWVYPNPHPSAKHRKKHKKQCGKIKGFELRTEPSTGASSDEVSSDEDVHAKKKHVPHQSPQNFQSQEQTYETVATESLPQIVDHHAILVEGDIITESDSNSLQPKEFSSLKVDAPDGELRDLPNVKDITTHMPPSVVPELPQNLPSFDQQNLPAGDNKKDAVVLDQALKVSCVSDEPDTSLTKESPNRSSMNDETLPNQAIVQEILGSSETQLNAIPSLSKSVDSLTSEGCGDLGKDAHVEHGSTTKLAEEPAGLSGECAPNDANIPSVSDVKSSDTSPTAYFEDKAASILKVEERSAVVMSAVDPRGVGLSNETLDASTGAGLNQSVILQEEIDVSEKPGLSGLDTASSLDDTRVGDPLRKELGNILTGGSNGQLEPENSDLSSRTLDDTLTRESDGQLEPDNSDLSSRTLPADEVPVENKSVTENPLPLRKEMDDTLTGGSGAQLEPEYRDLSSCTLAADKVPVENKSVTENLLPLTALSTANVTGLATKDAEEEGRFLSVQTSVNPVQLIPSNELSVQIVDGGNDDSLSSITEKTDETPPVTNMAHPLGSQTTSVGVAEVDVPKEVTIPAVTTGEAIAFTTGKTDETPPVNMAHPLGNQMTSVGVAEVDVPKEVTIPAGTTGEVISSTTDKTDETPPVTNMAHPLGNQTSVGVAEVDVPKEVTIPAVTTGEAISIQESLDGFTSKDVSSVSEDSSQGATGDTQNTNTTSFIAKDTGVSDINKESEIGGIFSVKDAEQDKTEASGALQAMAKPEAEEETPFETRGVGSSDLSYMETYSFTRSESGVTARSELGASSHKLSDSLEIYEDAQDSLETCSVGGSVEENESLDEPRQASDRLQEEPKHSGAASLDEKVPDESVVLEQKSTVSNGSKFGEASYEEKAPTFGEASYEQKAPTLPGTSYEEKAPTLPGSSYGGRKQMEDLKAPSPEAWQEPGPSNVPSNVKREGKKISTSEVTEDSKSGESHTALRSLMAKEGPEDKADQIVETSTAAGDLKSSSKKDGSLASANGTKNKSRSFWRHCICCSTVH